MDLVICGSLWVIDVNDFMVEVFGMFCSQVVLISSVNCTSLVLIGVKWGGGKGVKICKHVSLMVVGSLGCCVCVFFL